MRKKVVLHSNSTVVVAVFQARRSRDPFIQAYGREIWWKYAVNDIALSVIHTPEEQLPH